MKRHPWAAVMQQVGNWPCAVQWALDGTVLVLWWGHWPPHRVDLSARCPLSQTQHFIIKHVKPVGSDSFFTVTRSAAQPVSLLSCLFAFAFLRCTVRRSFTCRLGGKKQMVLLLRMKLNSRGLAGVNWGLMWFVLLALQAALPGPLNRFPCDYSNGLS